MAGSRANAAASLPRIPSLMNDPKTSKAVAVMRQEIEKQQVDVSPSRRHGATSSHFRKGSPRRHGAATSANWRASGSPRRHGRSPSKRAGYGGQFGTGGYATGYSPTPSKTLQGVGYDDPADLTGDGGSPDRGKRASQELLFPNPATFAKPAAQARSLSRTSYPMTGARSVSSPSLLGSSHAQGEKESSKSVKAPQSLLSLVSVEGNRRPSILRRRSSWGARPMLADAMAQMQMHPGM